MTLDAWLAGHPYLQPLALFTAEVDAVAGGIETPRAPIPVWENYAEDFGQGLPLVRSGSAGVDLVPAGSMAVALAGGLASRSPAGSPIAGIEDLDADLRGRRDSARLVADWLLGDDAFAPASPGLLRYLGWTAAARYLAPVIAAFAIWRAERWGRPYCPTCGSLPAMAQMVGAESVRLRFLSCGLCGTRWKYARTACPFCGNDVQKLDSLAVEGQAGLRIDYCEKCRGYLKTYDGTGDESLLLTDWTSLHLDFVARDRGLKRLAVSLYDLEPALQQTG